MTRKQKRTLVRILLAGILLIAAALLPLDGHPRLLAFLLPYAVIGYDVLWSAFRGIAHGQVFDENFLMALATVGGLAIGEYAEAVFVLLFYQVGELFQSIAVGKSRRSIAALMDIRPDVARIARTDETGTTYYAEVAPQEVVPGDIIQILPGDRVPLDGEVIAGQAQLNTAALTGEPLPRAVAEGDAVISGCINEDGVLLVRVSRSYEMSTVARILELVERSAERKSRSEAFITRFARIYTPAVVAGAVLLALVPSLIMGEPLIWVRRALTFLVVSCPCALVISVPLSFFGGIGGASKRGILFKGSHALEALGQCDTVVLDKTGTLTRGTFRMTACLPSAGVTEEELLSLAAAVEQCSTHPIARAIVADAPMLADAAQVQEVQNHAGQGMTALLDGRSVAVGNAALMAGQGISVPAEEADGSVVYVAREGVYLGALVLRDEVKPEAREALSALRRAGVKRTVMLTGDRHAAAAAVAAELAVDDYVAECMPDDKVTHMERLLGEKRGRGKVAFVGDGINDAPVLMLADVGIAMGALGSDAAIEAADVVLMDDRLLGIAEAMQISRRTGHIVRQNIVFSLSVKAAVLALCATGVTGMWAAVLADVGVAVVAILNAMRTLK